MEPVGGQWAVKQLPGYVSRTPEEIRVLWSADLPPDRDTDPALWDTLIGFFEDAAVAACERPGSLVTTPRSLLKLFKHEGREPSAGRAVIEELFRRGDIARAESLTASPDSSTHSTSVGYGGIVRSVMAKYLWASPTKPATLEIDEPIVPTAALRAAAGRAKDRLGGPVSTDDIHTVQSFAREFTARQIRDAEAVIGHLVKENAASVLVTDPSSENSANVTGFKFGTTPATETDKGILQTKAALQRMDELSSHLERSVAEETTAATAAAKSGNKGDALSHLRKKKLLENKLAGARASVHKLTDVLMSVDEAASNKEAVEALEIGMGSLRTANENGVSVARLDAIAADYAEHAADQEDIRVAWEQINQGPEITDYSAEEAELAAMLAAEEAGHPVAPPEPQGTTEEEEELDKIMAELGIAKNDTADLPVPPSPSLETPETPSPSLETPERNAATPSRRLAAPELS